MVAINVNWGLGPFDHLVTFALRHWERPQRSTDSRGGRNEQCHPVPAREQSPSYDFGRPRRSSDLVLHWRAVPALGRRRARSSTASAKLPAKARARSDWRNRKGTEEPTLTAATRSGRRF